MARHRIVHLLVSASEIGLLCFFAVAVWVDVTGKEELKPIVGISFDVLLAALAILFMAYVVAFANRRRAFKKEWGVRSLSRNSRA